MTEQRKLIKKIIVNSTKHLCAEEIFLEAKKEMPKIAFGTVYRNLGLLVDSGEIIKVSSLNGVVHYDKTIFNHEHMVCEKCGRVEDIMELDLHSFISKYQQKYHITGYECIIKHICDDCQKKEKK